MKKIFLLFSLSLALHGFGQQPAIQVIPEPAEIRSGEGFLVLNPSSSISIPDGNPALAKAVEIFATQLSAATGFRVPVRPGGANTRNVGNINIDINKNADAALGNEGYKLSVTNAGVNITANKAAGAFYALQTILQLLPKEAVSKTQVKDIEWKIPVVEITDYPRFGWRGLMFDVSRHFFTKQEVKDFIDDMVRYKYNLLHWHLTDDEGWRIEIKSLPKLTEVGAWNVKRTGHFGNFVPPTDAEPRNYGGFYTQDDIKEVIQYASERFVNILPEVDIPGHSLAAIASYPDLSCTPGADKYRVRSGEKIMDWHANGFTALIDNTLCPANEKVYLFLDKVFTEVAQLFPFDYIHMGGDECAKNFWEKSPQVKALMQKEKLKDMHEVQAYFVKRVSKIITSKGKKLIGWDEILEGGDLPKSATVMSWRGMKGGIEAAKMGHDVVMTPTTFVYLDYMQTDPAIEPPVYATLRLKTTYSFEPVPDGIDPKLIRGGQGNIWTEQIYNTRHLQYMVWPRAFAVAEVLWSPKNKRNWDNFVPRVEAQFARYDILNMKYSPALYDPIVKVKKGNNDEMLVDFDRELNNVDIYYSFDNSFPDQFYPKYDGNPIPVPIDASNLKLIAYKDGRPVGRLITLTSAEMKKRAGVK